MVLVGCGVGKEAVTVPEDGAPYVEAIHEYWWEATGQCSRSDMECVVSRSTAQARVIVGLRDVPGTPPPEFAGLVDAATGMASKQLRAGERLHDCLERVGALWGEQECRVEVIRLAEVGDETRGRLAGWKAYL